MDTTTSSGPIRILHLEDSVSDHRLVCRALDTANFNYSVLRVDTLSAFTEAATSGKVDVILADYRLSGFTAIDAWSALGTIVPRPPFILLSGAIGESAAVTSIHLGISDYLHKDDLVQLRRVILRTLEVHQARLASEVAATELANSEKRLSDLAGHLQAAIERERAAIAREIHDDIGGSLAAAKLDLAWLSRHTTNAESQSHILAATETLQHALGASQRIMMNLRPSILDQGLVAAVQWLAVGFEQRTGIKTQLRTSSESLRPPPEVQLTAYRTAQEALTNISKYAKCSLVQIDISDAEGFLTLEVSDDGVGISEQERVKTDAFGIRGLHERARAVGGWLDISSRQGVGTSIILSVPLRDESVHSFEGQFK
jgi:signal transduction histidine kinase